MTATRALDDRVLLAQLQGGRVDAGIRVLRPALDRLARDGYIEQIRNGLSATLTPKGEAYAAELRAAREAVA